MTSKLPHLLILVMLASMLACVYGMIAALSRHFEYGSSVLQRPIITVLLLFFVAFGLYLTAVRIAVRARQDGRLMGIIVCGALVFRVVLLSSAPIQEIDIYRYLWDGSVASIGVSPYRFSPEQVRISALPLSDDDLRRVVRMRDQEPATADILNRVHYGELPTVYPPISQFVFAAATRTTPSGSSVATRVFIMKMWLVGFDLATLGFVIGILKLCHKPVGLCLIYAWCPLLLKEVANSGHLDSVAVCLTTATVYLAVRFLLRFDRNESVATSAVIQGIVTAMTLALAIGAKLYPVVLAPLFLLVFARKLGWARVIVPALTFAATTLAVVWPLFPHNGRTMQLQMSPDNADPPSPNVHVAAFSDPSLGITTFLRRWEMNDFLFLLLVENLKPTDRQAAHQAAWFVIIPNDIRAGLMTSLSNLTGLHEHEAAVFTARVLFTVVFLTIAIWLALRVSREPTAESFCRACFLTVAWFWLLCPTQNPWYWIWALPLLPFARSRVWLAMSGLVFLYYLRFWLDYHFPEGPVLGTHYTGAVFFDFVVTWFEFAPWFFALAVSTYWRTRPLFHPITITDQDHRSRHW